MTRLDQIVSAPVAPSLHNVDHRAVERWAEQAVAGLASRRKALRLVRAVERVLAEECRTARQVFHARERIEQRHHLASERAAGTYWRRRDSGRRAQQPTHVEVDPAAWRRARAEASRQGVGIGDYVGRLVARATSASLRDGDRDVRETVRLFARVAVARPLWAAFVANAQEAGTTVARAIGLLVEDA